MRIRGGRSQRLRPGAFEQEGTKRRRGFATGQRSGRAGSRPRTRSPETSRARLNLDPDPCCDLRQARNACRNRPSAGQPRMWRQRRGARRARQPGANERAVVSNQPSAIGHSTVQSHLASSRAIPRQERSSHSQQASRPGHPLAWRKIRTAVLLWRKPKFALARRETWGSVVIRPITVQSSRIQKGASAETFKVHGDRNLSGVTQSTNRHPPKRVPGGSSRGNSALRSGMNRINSRQDRVPVGASGERKGPPGGGNPRCDGSRC